MSAHPHPRYPLPPRCRFTQPELPFVGSSDTSVAAAEAMEDDAPTLRTQVYLAIFDRAGHGATDEELQHLLRMNPSTERPRRIELVRLGLVKDSDRTRRTASGRQAVVWVAEMKCRAAEGA